MISWIPIETQTHDETQGRHPIVVMNLKERKDRLEDFENSWQHFSLYKNKRIDFVQMQALPHGSSIDLDNSKTTKFSNGCTASHACVYKKMLDLNVPNWTVFEDDAYVTDRVRFEALFLEGIDNPSILQQQGLIQWGPSTLRSPHNDLQLEIIPWNKSFFVSRNSLATHALTMNRDFAHRALQTIQKQTHLPIDTIMFQKMNVSMAIPYAVPIVLQSAGFSDVVHSDVNYARMWAAVLRDRKSFVAQNESNLKNIDVTLDPNSHILHIDNGPLTSILEQIAVFASAKSPEVLGKLEIWGLQNSEQEKALQNIQFSHKTFLHNTKSTKKDEKTFFQSSEFQKGFQFVAEHLNIDTFMDLNMDLKYAFLHIKGGSFIHEWSRAKQHFQGCPAMQKDILSKVQQQPVGTIFRIFTNDISFCQKQLRLDSLLKDHEIQFEQSPLCGDFSTDNHSNISEASILFSMLQCEAGGIASQSKMSQWAVCIGKELGKSGNALYL